MSKKISQFTELTSVSPTDQIAGISGGVSIRLPISTLSTYLDGIIGGGVPDGDKGDITVSGSGLTWTIDNNAITTAKILDANVTTAKIADSNVTTAKIADSNVTTAKINNAAVTLAKMANMATASFIGRNTAGSGVPEILSATTAKSILGLGTTDNPQFATIELGAASDTTLSRVSAGVVAIEGNNILTTANEGTGNGLDADTVDGIEASAFLQNVSEDTTPQLGGSLDVNGNPITSASNGDVTIDPNGTGSIILGAGTVTLEGDLVHSGDTDNKVAFGIDTQSYETGGTARMNISNTGLQVGTGARVTTILDEDNMASNSATALATQQSIKAYVDSASGGILQSVVGQTTTSGFTSTSIPLDNTVPQNTEGGEVVTVSITPTSATSKLTIICNIAAACDAGGKHCSMALFQDSTASALAATTVFAGDAAAEVQQMDIVHTMTSGTTSSTTFKLRIGSNDGTAVRWNGRSGAQLFNATMMATITVIEIG